MFFALSDMYINPTQHFGKQFNKIKESQLKLRSELLSYTDEEKLKIADYDIRMSKLNNIEISLEKNLKEIKRMRIYGYVFFAIGIFAFMTIITFYNADSKLFEFILRFENKITIYAFAFVMFNYLMQDIVYDKLEKGFEALERAEENKKMCESKKEFSNE